MTDEKIEEQTERNSPRESKPFGKRRTVKRDLPNDKKLKDVFGIVNNGYDSNQIKIFIRKTTGYEMKEYTYDRKTKAGIKR